jgi:hypothetical protein
MFFWGFAMFLFGTIIGAHWHPSLAHSLEIAVAAGIFTVLHELLPCFVWCSLSAWWIGRRTGAFDRKAGARRNAPKP